jgi:hypothetical protein
LGALPLPGQGAIAPSIRGATAVDCQRNQANALLLPTNPLSVNLHHTALRNVSPTDELLGEGGESGENEGLLANEEDEVGGGGRVVDFTADNDDEEVEAEEFGGADGNAVAIPFDALQPAGVLGGIVVVDNADVVGGKNVASIFVQKIYCTSNMVFFMSPCYLSSFLVLDSEAVGDGGRGGGRGRGGRGEQGCGG